MAPARLLLIAAAALFSTAGAAVKGTSLNALQLAGLRSLIAAIAVMMILPDARRGWRWRYLPVAASYAATLILFISATKLTTAANAIFLQGSAPLFVLLLSPLVLKEHIHRADVALMIVLAMGMTLCLLASGGSRATAPDPATGNILGACTAVTWALTLIGLRWIGRGTPAGSDAGMRTVSMGNLLTSVVALPFAFPFAQFQIRDAAVVLWLGLFQVALAYVLLTRGLRSVPAMEATLLLMLEPALNPVWAWMVHGERPAIQSVAGGAIILLGIAGKAWWQRRTAPAY